MHIELAFVAMFTIASAVAILAKRVKLPYTVALVIAGLVVGSFDALHVPPLTKELLFAVILPGLLFEAAFHVEDKRFRNNILPISSLAIPGVAFSIGLTAFLLMQLSNGLGLAEELSWAAAAVFGALICATDPIAVVGLFKTLGAPKRLAVLVEGESLLNDGTAVVLFAIILEVAIGHPFSLSESVVEFLRVVGGGALIGASMGWAVAQITKRVDEPMIEITLTVIAAYGSFVFAEQGHFSGVIATVVAGMMCGNYASAIGMSPTTRISVESFWEYLAFALNSVVFLLIGFEVDLAILIWYWAPILAAYLAVNLARTVVVAFATAIFSKSSKKIPWNWAPVLSWGGLRGAISMVLVLGLPTDFHNRELLVHMTFGVVLLSIVVQGITMGPLLKFLGLTQRSETHVFYERAWGRVRAMHAVISELSRLEGAKLVHAEVAEPLRADARRRLKQAEEGIEALHLEESSLREEERLSISRHLIVIEKDALAKDYRSGYLDAEVYEELIHDADARLMGVEEHGGVPEESE